MKVVLAFALGGFSVYMVSRAGVMGLFIAYFIGLVLVLSVMSIRDRYRRVNLLKEWANKIGPIPIYAANPLDEAELKGIYLRSKEANDLLKASGNQFAYVVPFYFQDHRNVNETADEYLQRVSATIASERAKSLPAVHKTEGEAFFLKNVAFQKGL